MTLFNRRATDVQDPKPAPGASGVPVAELPQATIAFCVKHKIHPVPAVYETVYVYLLGVNQALNLAFAGELNRGALSQSIVLRLYGDYLPGGQRALGISEVGTGLSHEVEQVTDVVRAGLEAGGAVKTELTRLTDGLKRAPSLQFVVESAGQIREIGLRQLAANNRLRETLRLTSGRLSELERDLERHMEEANTDHLTKLPNRRAIDGRLHRTFARPFDEASRDCLVMIDIDHFKSINDTHGHDIGDSVIRMVASLLKKGAGPTGYPARWGGEEFALLLTGTDNEAAVRIAEDIRIALAAARWNRKKDGEPLGVITASFGVAERKDGDSLLIFAKRADAALYAAKAAGRNCTILRLD